MIVYTVVNKKSGFRLLTLFAHYFSQSFLSKRVDVFPFNYNCLLKTTRGWWRHHSGVFVFSRDLGRSTMYWTLETLFDLLGPGSLRRDASLSIIMNIISVRPYSSSFTCGTLVYSFTKQLLLCKTIFKRLRYLATLFLQYSLNVRPSWNIILWDLRYYHFVYFKTCYNFKSWCWDI